MIDSVGYQLFVNGVVQCLPYLKIVEGRAGHVHAHVADAELRWGHLELTAQGTGWVKNKLWTDRADLGHVDLIAKVHLQGIATTEDETHRLQPGDAQVVSFISLQDQYVLGPCTGQD